VIDKGRHVRLYEDNGSSLSFIHELIGDYRQYFQDIKTDHFGNIYLVDNVSGQILKYTSDLQYLDMMGDPEVLDSPGALDIPFGKIEIEGKGTYWAGFDQMFTAERWAETTGAVRAILGVGLRDIRFMTDDNVSTVASSFTLTDFGDVAVKVYDSDNRQVRLIHDGWMVSGQKSITWDPWDRYDDAGNQVPPGVYRYAIEAVSGYRDDATVSQTEFYLPMYYWQDCGSNVITNDAMLAQGSAVVWGPGPSQTASEHASEVVYRFSGLNPGSEYEIAAEYISKDGTPRLQDLSAGSVVLHEPVPVTPDVFQTEFLDVPAESFEDGNLTISIRSRGEGSAIVSQLWLKETGVGFSPTHLDGTKPVSYSLEQNYPNPFNPSTVIRYALPVDGPVSLTVYDIGGREIATLVNSFQVAGTYEVQFDAKAIGNGKSLASGVYFYRVKAGTFSEAKKMVLLK
jgi:hypothetical protein